MTKVLESTRATDSSQSTINDTNGTWDTLYAILRKAELLTNDRSSKESQITQWLPTLTLSEAQDAKRTEWDAFDLERKGWATPLADFAEDWLRVRGGISSRLEPRALEIVQEANGEYFLKTDSVPVTKDYKRNCFLLKNGTIIRQKEDMTAISTSWGLLEIRPDAVRAQMSAEYTKHFPFTKNAEVSVDCPKGSSSSDFGLKTDSYEYYFTAERGKVSMAKTDLKTGQRTDETVEVVGEYINGFFSHFKCTFKDGTIVQLDIEDGCGRISLSIPFAKDSEYRHNVWIKPNYIPHKALTDRSSEQPLTRVTYEIAKNSNLPMQPDRFELDYYD